MAVCETLPLCRDATLTESTPTSLTEPMEVGPYREGIVFVKVTDVTGDAGASVRVGISPTGYEDWDEHWVVSETRSVEAEGMYAIDVTNFGNWLRLQFEFEDSASDEDPPSDEGDGDATSERDDSDAANDGDGGDTTSDAANDGDGGDTTSDGDATSGDEEVTLFAWFVGKD